MNKSVMGSLTDSTSVQRFAILNTVAWSEAVDTQSVRFQSGPFFIMIHGKGLKSAIADLLCYAR